MIPIHKKTNKEHLYTYQYLTIAVQQFLFHLVQPEFLRYTVLG